MRKWVWWISIPLILVTGLAIWAFFIEPNRLVIHRETIVISDWPYELDGLRAAVLSDIHAGSSFINKAKLDEIVAKTNAENPDLVLLLGDFMVRNRAYRDDPLDPEVIANALGGLKGKIGVYAVLGNHDWWYNGVRVQQELQRAGIRVLENDVASIQVAQREFFIWGIADMWTRPQAISGMDSRIVSGEPVIAMTHNPDIFPDIPAEVALTLAGHTHGGQVNIPFLGRPIVPSRFGQRYAAGLVHDGHKQMFVTTGIGTSILPVRFRVPPEIVLLTLKSR